MTTLSQVEELVYVGRTILVVFEEEIVRSVETY